MRPADEVLDEFQRLQVDSVEEAAEAMGMPWRTLEKILERARARGDARGNYKPMRIRKPSPPARSRFQEILGGWNNQCGGLTYDEAAEEIGCSPYALASTLSRARKQGLYVGPGSGYHTKASRVSEEWEFLKEAGVSIDEAAQRLGVTPTTLRRIA